VITHSTVEAELLRKHVPPNRVHRVLWSVPVKPTGVPFEKRGGIAFIGGFGHEPNLDAAR
jgi:O-antigen biosynthesis protein